MGARMFAIVCACSMLLIGAVATAAPYCESQAFKNKAGDTDVHDLQLGFIDDRRFVVVDAGKHRLHVVDERCTVSTTPIVVEPYGRIFAGPEGVLIGAYSKAADGSVIERRTLDGIQRGALSHPEHMDLSGHDNLLGSGPLVASEMRISHHPSPTRSGITVWGAGTPRTVWTPEQPADGMSYPLQLVGLSAAHGLLVTRFRSDLIVYRVSDAKEQLRFSLPKSCGASASWTDATELLWLCEDTGAGLHAGLVDRAGHAVWDAHYRYEDMNEAQQIGVDAHARVFVTETDGQLKIYSTRTGKLIHELPGTHTYPKRATVQVKLSPDGRHVAVSHQDGSLRVWTLPAELSPR